MDWRCAFNKPGMENSLRSLGGIVGGCQMLNVRRLGGGGDDETGQEKSSLFERYWIKWTTVHREH